MSKIIHATNGHTEPRSSCNSTATMPTTLAIAMACPLGYDVSLNSPRAGHSAGRGRWNANFEERTDEIVADRNDRDCHDKVGASPLLPEVPTGGTENGNEYEICPEPWEKHDRLVDHERQSRVNVLQKRDLDRQTVQPTTHLHNDKGEQRTDRQGSNRGHGHATPISPAPISG